MRTFWTVLKNNYLRTIPRIIPMIFITLVTLASIVLAVHITGIQQVKGHIAFITKDFNETVPNSTKQLKITVMSEKPPYSTLVEQKYDAFVTLDENGNYKMITLRSEKYKNLLLFLLHNPTASVKDFKNERGVGVNIIGFMMMFLLMLSFSNLFAFADDKEKGQLKRISAAPASFGGYLAANCVYCLSMLLPEYLLIVVLKLVGLNIGFSILQYAGLMGVLGFLGISFALLLNTLIGKPDNATMLGNSITVLTSVLAGSFYSFSQNNSVIDIITKLLPQKELMDFAQSLQNKDALQHMSSILYIIIFSTSLFLISCIILRQKYIKKV